MLRCVLHRFYATHQTTTVTASRIVNNSIRPFKTIGSLNEYVRPFDTKHLVVKKIMCGCICTYFFVSILSV